MKEDIIQSRRLIIDYLVNENPSSSICCVCLACTDSNDDMFSIYDTINIQTTYSDPSTVVIAAVLEDVLNSKIEYECLPTTLCLSCRDNLIRTYIFKKNCKNIHNLWQSSINNMSYICNLDVSLLNEESDRPSLFLEAFSSKDDRKVCNTSNKENAQPIKCINDSNKFFICDICGKKLKWYLYLKHKHQSYFCDMCAFEGKSRSSMRHHLKNKHSERGKACPVCGKLFKTDAAVKHHQVVHTGTKKVKCLVCLKGFVNKAALLWHSRLHSGERPFSCSLCDKKFVNIARRNEHIKLKHNTTKYQCGICDIEFGNACQYKTHKKTHTDYDEDIIEYLVS